MSDVMPLLMLLLMLIYPRKLTDAGQWRQGWI